MTLGSLQQLTQNAVVTLLCSYYVCERPNAQVAVCSCLPMADGNPPGDN